MPPPPMADILVPPAPKPPNPTPRPPPSPSPVPPMPNGEAENAGPRLLRPPMPVASSVPRIPVRSAIAGASVCCSSSTTVDMDRCPVYRSHNYFILGNETAPHTGGRQQEIHAHR